MEPAADVVVVGAGIVGAAVAHECATAGLSVLVVDRGGVAGGTTGAGEGNLLVSDKPPGPELDLALLSLRRWREWADLIGADVEYEPKGGLVVAGDDRSLAALTALAEGQRAAGVEASPADPHAYEPHLAAGLAGAFFYPQDAQVMPALAAARLLRTPGVRLRLGVTATGLDRRGGTLRALRTDAGPIACGAVVNAAGTWAGEVAHAFGAGLPVAPRRGFILVTEPLPPLIRHKVYAADYVADVAADTAGLATSPVVEGTAAGPVLIGASRERVGFDRSTPLPVLRTLAARAAALFPVLADAAVLRAYHGFRPYTPDHLPIIGPDPALPGVWHACGHEGAGVGLAAGTGRVVAARLTGADPGVDLAPFAPDRFHREENQ